MYLTTVHYADTYTATFDSARPISNQELVTAFFANPPGWINFLLELRNKLVSVFGLKTASDQDRDQQLKSFKAQPGQSLGLFKVIGRTDHEIIMGEDDKHLNFRISFALTCTSNTYAWSITTIVQFNNRAGRFYFFPVKPFHKLIVPAMLKSCVIHVLNE